MVSILDLSSIQGVPSDEFSKWVLNPSFYYLQIKMLVMHENTSNELIMVFLMYFIILRLKPQ